MISVSVELESSVAASPPHPSKILIQSIPAVQEDVLLSLGSSTIQVNARDLLEAVRRAGGIYANATWTATTEE